MDKTEFERLPPAFHEKHMRAAMREAALAADAGEVPAGCVIIDASTGAILGKAHNMTESLKDPTAHAEVLAITQAATALGDWRLANAMLYATKEPCPMCGGAIVLARIPFVVWGLGDPKRGAQTTFKIFDAPGINHHPTTLEGILSADCLAQFQTFFREKRKEGNRE
jgi:Cytosine/adenosine deaminases